MTLVYWLYTVTGVLALVAAQVIPNAAVRYLLAGLVAAVIGY